MPPEDDVPTDRHRARVARIREIVNELDRTHRAAIDRIHELLNETERELTLLDDLWARNVAATGFEDLELT